MGGFLWTPWQTLGVGVEIFAAVMLTVIFLSLIPPLEFKGLRDYFKYLARFALGVIGMELFALVLVLVLVSIDQFFFPK